MLHKVFAVAFTVAGFCQITDALAAPEIVWEVENRFRFYRDAEPFKAYMRVAQQTGDASDRAWVFKTERRLQHDLANDWDVRWAGWAARWRDRICWDRSNFEFRVIGNNHRCDDYALPASHRVLVSVKGAAAGATCTWHVTDFGKEKSNKPAVYEQRRTTPKPNTSCHDVPLEVPYSIAGDAWLTVGVTLSDGGGELPAQRIVVTDLLVLGIGDSFGAGVGNPDFPPRIEQRHGVPYQDFLFQQGGEHAVPVRRGGFAGGLSAGVYPASGEWLDIRCFRSQYGPQFRSAIHLAISLSHVAVTYVDLACDGARIIEGLLNEKKLGRGFRSDVERNRPIAQIGFASRLLCTDRSPASDRVEYVLKAATGGAQCQNLGEKQICEYAEKEGRIATAWQNIERLQKTQMDVCKQSGNRFLRQIDVVLLSIGGNDIGFAPMVGDVIMDDKRIANQVLTFLGRELGSLHGGGIGRTRLELLESKYRVLDRAMKNHLPIRNGTKKPIFLTAYPMPVDDRDGALCGSNNENRIAADAALDVDQSFSRFHAQRTGKPREPTPATRLKDVARTTCLLNLRRFAWFDGGTDASNIADELTHNEAICSGMRGEANGDQDKKLNWQYVAEHLLTFRGHGFCAHQTNENPLQVLSVPRFFSAGDWRPILEKARPYDSRQRWVRTPNDAYVTTNWYAGGIYVQDFWNMLSAATTSAMHPTAEGYAAMADAILGRVLSYLCTERQQEFGREPFCPGH